MEMSASEIRGWEEYFEIYLTKRDRTDLQVGLVCSILLNSQRTKSTDKVFTASDFVPDYLNEKKPQEKSIEQQQYDADAFYQEYQRKLGK